jgi:hypothetical protein
MMYLLDTNVVSELRKATKARVGRPVIDRQVQAWASSVPNTDLYLSAITILELELGFLLLGRRDARQAAVLQSWVRDRVLVSFADRILGVDVAIAQRCAALLVPDPVDQCDALIAATALVHGMTVVTRNVSHFERTGVQIVNPWQD